MRTKVRARLLAFLCVLFQKKRTRNLLDGLQELVGASQKRAQLHRGLLAVGVHKRERVCVCV
jgi:hypothetical protein